MVEFFIFQFLSYISFLFSPSMTVAENASEEVSQLFFQNNLVFMKLPS